MATKLTLHVEDKLIRTAKKTARSKGISLSRMVSDYFRSIAAQQRNEIIDSPVLSEITGILSTKGNSKKFLADYWKHIEEKYR